MEIKSVEIKDFRGIRGMTLDFSDHINVLVGANGAGKSSVLDALAIMLSWFTARMRHSGASGRKIGELDIHNKASNSKLSARVLFEESGFHCSLVKTRKGRPKNHEKSSLKELNLVTRELQRRLEQTEGKCSIPLLVYYPVNRAVLDIPLRIRQKHDFGILDAYDDSLTSGSNFRTFFEWFRNREDLENENRKYRTADYRPENWEFPDPQLEAVRMAFAKVLPEFREFAVRRNPLRMTVNKNQDELRIDQLSDGEKCLIAMLGDLARRLAIANPNVDNALEGKAVVLIDEIDLHLHPAWQRMIIPSLRAAFPNSQFIVSTHSPQIISHVSAEDIFLLHQTKEGIDRSKPNEAYGKNTDRILEDLMGVDSRPREIKQRLHEVFLMIDQGELIKARKEISEIRMEIGEDPELVKAEVLIRRKEIIGK